MGRGLSADQGSDAAGRDDEPLEQISGTPATEAIAALIGSAWDTQTKVWPRWAAASRSRVAVMRCCIALKDSPSGNRKVLGSDWTVFHSRELAEVLELRPGPVPEVALEQTLVDLRRAVRAAPTAAGPSPRPARAASCRWPPALASVPRSARPWPGPACVPIVREVQARALSRQDLAGRRGACRDGPRARLLRSRWSAGGHEGHRIL